MLDPIYHRLAGLASPPAGSAMSWLGNFGRRSGNVVRAAVGDGCLSSLAISTWPDQRDALRRFFGHHDGHCFNAAGHSWISLTETQVTAGLVHFLNDRSATVRRLRVAALFNACGAGEVVAAALSEARAVAEYPIAQRGRLDIVAVAHGAGGPDRLLVVEAKLDHELSPGQLKRYEAGSLEVAQAEDLITPLMTLVVVATRRTTGTRTQLKQRPGWLFLSWAELIRRLERELPAEADDDDFRRFRRTVWERCA